MSIFRHLICAFYCFILTTTSLFSTPTVEDTNEQHAAPQEVSSSDETIYLNFQDATLASIINYIAEQKKLNVVPDKNLDKVKASFTSQTPLTLDDAWDTAQTLLDMNGFTVVKAGKLHKIIPSKEAGKESLTTFSSTEGVDPDHLADTDELIRYIYILENLNISIAQGILNKILSPNSVKINKNLSACIITEKSRSIKSAMQVIKNLDIGGLRESIKIIRLNYADAQTVANLFNEAIFDRKKKQQDARLIGPEKKQDASFFSESTKLVPDPVNNCLILLGTEANLNKIIDFIAKHIDVPITSEQSRLHVKEIQYVSAEKLKAILENIIRPPRGQQKEKTTLVGTFKFFEDVIIAAEEPPGATEGQSLNGYGNRLVISCNKDDWKRLESFIDKLDKPQPQVAMEVMIVDATNDITRALGAQLRNKEGWLGRNVNAEAMHLALDTSGQFFSQSNLVGIAAGNVPGTYATLGDTTDEFATGNVWGVIQAILTKNNANIISQPFLVANNNTKALLEDIQTELVPGRINDGSNTTGVRTRTEEEVSAVTKVELTPWSNSDGIINLLVEVDISSFQEITTELDQPRRTTRKLITQASMGTGEVLVVGGITLTRVSETYRKTPILGDIPIIGNLFKRKQKSDRSTNLYIFIRPSVIKPVFEGRPDDYTELKLAYAKYQILGAETYLKDNDPIQRWFFRPQNTTISQRLADIKEGRYRPVDDFAQGKYFPPTTNISHDPFYRTRDDLAREKQKRMKKKKGDKDLKMLSSLKRRGD